MVAPDVEDQLQQLAARRAVLEERIKMRLATASEFGALRVKRLGKTKANFLGQCEIAQKRNEAYLTKVYEATSAFQKRAEAIASARRLREERERFRVAAERMYPAWQEEQMHKDVKELQRLERERFESEMRRAAANEAFAREVALRAAVEDQRRELAVAQIQEHGEGSERFLRREHLQKQARKADYHLQADATQAVRDTLWNLAAGANSNAVTAAAAAGLAAAATAAPAASAERSSSRAQEAIGSNLPARKTEQRSVPAASTPVRAPAVGRPAGEPSGVDRTPLAKSPDGFSSDTPLRDRLTSEASEEAAGAAARKQAEYLSRKFAAEMAIAEAPVAGTLSATVPVDFTPGNLLRAPQPYSDSAASLSGSSAGGRDMRRCSTAAVAAAAAAAAAAGRSAAAVAARGRSDSSFSQEADDDRALSLPPLLHRGAESSRSKPTRSSLASLNPLSPGESPARSSAADAAPVPVMLGTGKRRPPLKLPGAMGISGGVSLTELEEDEWA